MSIVESAFGLTKTILMQKSLEHGSTRTMVPDGTCQSPKNGEVCALRVAEHRKIAKNKIKESVSGRWRIGVTPVKRFAWRRSNEPEG
jgi:hypothetical protein